MDQSFIEKALTKIQSIPDKRGKLVTACRGIISISKIAGPPMSEYIGSALSLGAAIIKSPSPSAIEKPGPGVRTDSVKVQEDLRDILKEVKEENAKHNEEIARMQDVVYRTLFFALIMKYKVDLVEDHSTKIIL